MRTLKAQVRNGRLVLDEPTDLPEGAEVDVAVFDDELTPEERIELHASLDRALADTKERRGVDAWEYLVRYKHLPESHLDELNRRLDAADRDGGEGVDWGIVSDRLRRSMPRK